MKETRKYITYYMPGSFFPESHTERVESFVTPKTLPKDCFGFDFHETDFIVDEGKDFAGATRKVGVRNLVGWIVPMNDIPDNDNYSILKGNIERNSPSKEAVRTRMGNWQMNDGDNTVLDPSSFSYSEPLFWKNAEPINDWRDHL
jgi:hypothetical protein